MGPCPLFGGCVFFVKKPFLCVVSISNIPTRHVIIIAYYDVKIPSNRGNRDVSACHLNVRKMANAPVVSPVLSVSPPPCKDERFSVGMEEWTDSASKSPPSRSPTRPVTMKRQRYSKGEQVREEPLPRGLR